MTVLAMDMVAPCSGTHHLSDFFAEHAAENEHAAEGEKGQ
jgi:hypothetical protein